MHITRLQAHNVKKLKAVDVEFDEENAVTIQGPNSAGKSSILDAIWFALGGGRTFKDQEVIRKGEEEAEAIVDLDGFRIIRKWTESGSYLKVMDTEGREYSSPQSMLDEFAQAFMFDPLAFLELHPSEQKAKLLELSGHADELETLEADYDEVYQERRDINRDVRKLESQVEAMEDVDEDLADEEVPTTADLMEELDAAKESRRRKQGLTSSIEENRSQAEELRNKAQALEEEADAWEEEVDEIEVPDIDALKEKVEEADEKRDQVEAAKDKVQFVEELEEAQEASEEKTLRLEEIEEEKQAIIEEADLPEGIGFDEDAVTFNGLPLAQAGMSEKLRVSMNIAMHMDPKLKIVQLRDASLLDDDARAEVEAMAEEMDFQVLLELVGPADGDASILIEDGEIVNDEGDGE